MGTTFGSGSFLYSSDGGGNIWISTLWEDTIVLYTAP